MRLNRISALLFLLFLLPQLLAEIIFGEILFEGNLSFSDQILQNVIRSRSGKEFDQKLLNDDVQRIADYYASHKKLNVKVFPAQIKPAAEEIIDVLFQIWENDEERINSTIISGSNYISTQRLNQMISLENFELSVLEDKLKEIVFYYADNGFLFAKAVLDSLRKENDGLIAYISVSEGNYCQFDEYKFSGNKITKAHTLLRISQINSSKIISPSVLRKAADNVRSRDYIRSCELVPLNAKQLLFQIEEDRMSRIAGILGYDNSKKADQKFAGYLSFYFYNLSGTDRSLAFLWRSISKDHSSIKLEYHEPGFWNYPISADLSLQREEADSTYIRSQINADIYYYNLFQKYGIFGGWDNIYPGSRRPTIIEEKSYLRLGVLAQHSNIDFFQNPTRGFETGVRYYYIIHKQNKKNLSRQAVEAFYQTYHRLISRIVLAAKFNLKVIENKQIDFFDYFYLGGQSNLRGFEENQFAGHQIGWMNLELRLITSRLSHLFIFMDYGYVNSREFTFNDLVGLGTGLNLQTRLGKLSITYGIGHQQGKLRNPLDGIIHFGIESKL
jgi:outer membrane protein assembly factor BamA